MKRILKVLEEELEANQISIKGYKDFIKKLIEEKHKLKLEVDMLRKDLQELSQEYFKQK